MVYPGPPLAALPGCTAIADLGHVRDGLWSGSRPPAGHAPALGSGETWDISATQEEFNNRLSDLLQEDGITWEPGSPSAILDGMTTAGAAATWLQAIDRLERFLDMVTAQAAAGRPSGDGVRPQDAPGAAWVTAISPGTIPLP